MFELLVVAAFLWLFIKGLGLAFRVTWGLTKAVAIVLFVLAMPALLGCLLLAGGVLLLIPVALVGIAFGILKAAVESCRWEDAFAPYSSLFGEIGGIFRVPDRLFQKWPVVQYSRKQKHHTYHNY